MIARLATNELRLLARVPSVRAAAVVYVLALGLGTLMFLPVPFVDTTSTAGTPALDVSWWLWAVLTPWWTSRLLSVARGDALVAMSAQAGIPAEQMILAQLAAAFLFAVELALASLPIGLLAFASTRASAADVLGGAAALTSLGALSIVTTFHLSIRNEHRLLSWLTATALTIAAAAGFGRVDAALGAGGATAVFIAAAIALGVLLPVRARRQLQYMTR